QSWEDELAFESANRAAMHKAIGELARRRPAQKIVVRPHPSENPRRWDGLFADCGNVAIVREGSHVPWTLACSVLLHTSCTTGFEAHVGGRTALSLVPQPSWVSSTHVANHVNPTFATPEEVVAAAESVLDGGVFPTDPARARAAERYVWNCGSNSGTQR